VTTATRLRLAAIDFAEGRITIEELAAAKADHELELRRAQEAPAQTAVVHRVDGTVRDSVQVAATAAVRPDRVQEEIWPSITIDDLPHEMRPYESLDAFVRRVTQEATQP
jgi:hypothetical protein